MGPPAGRVAKKLKKRGENEVRRGGAASPQYLKFLAHARVQHNIDPTTVRGWSYPTPPEEEGGGGGVGSGGGGGGRSGGGGGRSGSGGSGSNSGGGAGADVDEVDYVGLLFCLYVKLIVFLTQRRHH
jgi:hypothetical protein